MMPHADPISMAFAIIGGAVFIGLLCVLCIALGFWLAEKFSRGQKRREIERHISAMSTCATEGGRKHRPF